MAGSDSTTPRLLADTLTLALYNLLIPVDILCPTVRKAHHIETFRVAHLGSADHLWFGQLWAR